MAALRNLGEKARDSFEIVKDKIAGNSSYDNERRERDCREGDCRDDRQCTDYAYGGQCRDTTAREGMIRQPGVRDEMTQGAGVIGNEVREPGAFGNQLGETGVIGGPYGETGIRREGRLYEAGERRNEF